MNRLVRWCVAGLLIATAPLIAMAAVPNYQGMWYNAPAESEAGWGINFAHQGDAIFATWFTHDANGKAWNLSMSAFQTGANTFAGTLVVVTGPPFGTVPFDLTQVHATPVGDGTLTFTDGENGTFRYTVNGITQTKPLVRSVRRDADVHLGCSGEPRTRHQLPGHVVGVAAAGRGIGLGGHASPTKGT